MLPPFFIEGEDKGEDKGDSCKQRREKRSRSSDRPEKSDDEREGEIERNLKLGKEESVIVRSAMLSVEKIIIMGVITLIVIFIVIALRAVMKTIILMRMMVGLEYLIDVGVMIVNF